MSQWDNIFMEENPQQKPSPCGTKLEDAMANTFTQIYIQAVFVVKNRDCLINKKWEDELYKYITGIVQGNNHKMLVVNGVSDHIHMFVNIKPDQSVSDLLKEVKGSSSKWINEKGFLRGKFNWQAGYGAFSYSKSQIDRVIKYINRQEEHHKKKSFKVEYQALLDAFEIEYNKKYLFDWIE